MFWCNSLIHKHRVWLWLATFLATGCQMSPEVLLPQQNSEAVLPQISKTEIDSGVQEPKALSRRAHLGRLQNLLLNDQLKEAESLLLRRVEKHANDKVAQTNLALLYLRTDRVPQAEALFKQVVSQDSGYCPALVALAQIELQRLQIDLAQTRYQQCLSQQSDYAAALLNLGILLELYRGDFQGALTYYEAYQAVAVEPKQQVARWITDLHRRRDVADQTNQIAEVSP